jgi:hypothetical protein
MGTRKITDLVSGTNVSDAINLGQLTSYKPSELLDENVADGNIYGIKVRNNQVELYRGTALAPDTFLKVFGSDGSNAAILEINKRSFFLESEEDASELNLYRRLKATSVN